MKDKYGVEYSEDKKTLIKCPTGFEGEYVIPVGVSEISLDAFKGCIKLKSISIPTSVCEISDSAFSGCINLKNVTIENGVAQISSFAFHNCGIENITIPESVKIIGRDAFSKCSSLSILNLSYGLECICDNAFEGCSSLVSVTIPKSVSLIRKEAFAGCESLKSLVIPSNVREIEYEAFRGCVGLASITIENGLEIIGHAAFARCHALKKVVLPHSIKQIEKNAFYRCDDLSDIIIPNGEKERFASMDGLQEYSSLFNEEQYKTFYQEDFDALGVRAPSIAKIIGTVYQREFINKRKTLDICGLKNEVEKQWADIIAAYNALRSPYVDENKKVKIHQELDVPLSNGSITLETLGVKYPADFYELIDFLSDEKEIYEIMKEVPADNDEDEWVDTTKLDGNDAIQSFIKLTDESNSCFEDYLSRLIPLRNCARGIEEYGNAKKKHQNMSMEIKNGVSKDKQYSFKGKCNNKCVVLDRNEIEDLDFRLPSIAQIIGTIYKREFLDIKIKLDIDKLYDDVKSQWNDVIYAYNKANEKEADVEIDDSKLNTPLLNDSVTLETLGVKNAKDFCELIDLLTDEKDVDEIMKEVSADNDEYEWVDTTKLDGNDAIASFDALIDEFNSVKDEFDDNLS